MELEYLNIRRLLAIVSTAKWVVHRITKDPPVLTNELGYALSKTGEKLEISISIPFATKFLVLSIIPRIKR